MSELTPLERAANHAGQNRMRNRPEPNDHRSGRRTWVRVITGVVPPCGYLMAFPSPHIGHRSSPSNRMSPLVLDSAHTPIERPQEGHFADKNHKSAPTHTITREVRRAVL